MTELAIAGSVALFPGQGSQTHDMRDLVERELPDLLERCIELVGEDPFPRVAESTRFAQPAIFCASMANWSRLSLQPQAAAGHSLGELAALAAAQILSTEAALELVVLRGKLMAEADPDGTMLALVGATSETAQTIANKANVTVANDNAPGQIVLSGDPNDLETAGKVAIEEGVRPLQLPVAGAFHSPAMQPAVKPFKQALEQVEFASEGDFPVISCASTKPFTNYSEELAQALVRPVRWRETVLALQEAGTTQFVDVGPGRILANMCKRITADVPFTTAANLSKAGADV